MTLEEAIQHYEEVAEEYEDKVKRWKGDYPVCKAIMSCQKCADEHRQLAEWLKELKSYREHNSIPASSENRVKLEHIECEDAVSRTDDLISRQEG